MTTGERRVVCEGPPGGADDRLISALIVDRLRRGQPVLVVAGGGSAGLGALTDFYASRGTPCLQLEDRDTSPRARVELQLQGLKPLTHANLKARCAWRRRSVEAYLLQPEVLLQAARAFRASATASPLPSTAQAMATALDQLAAPLVPALAAERALAALRGQLGDHHPLALTLKGQWGQTAADCVAALRAEAARVAAAAGAWTSHSALGPACVDAAYHAAMAALSGPEVDAEGNNPIALWQLVDGHALMGAVAAWLAGNGRSVSAAGLTEALIEALDAFPDAAAPELQTIRACLGG
jgi:hypothetical protein